MLLDKKIVSIIVYPSEKITGTGVRIIEKNEKQLSIEKETNDERRIEYHIPPEVTQLITEQLKNEDPILTKKWEKWLKKDAERLGCGILSHPLLQTKCILPNHVSEYGRIKDYRIASDIWRAAQLYYDK